MRILRPLSRRSIARNVLAFAAAYLLVLQTVVAGLASQQMMVHAAANAEVICLNSVSDADGAAEHHQSPFSCCGVGCLVGAQALEGPSAPDQRLAYPAERGYEPAAAALPGETRPRAVESSGPRAPPAAG